MKQHSSKASRSRAEDTLKPNRILYGVAAFTYFSDKLLGSFLFPYAVVTGVSFDQMGLIRSTRNLCQNMLQMGWGEISERFSKRLLVFLGYLLSGCFIVALLFFRSPAHLLAIIILHSIFWSAAVPAWNSLLADYTKLETRGQVLGKIGSVSQLSGVVATVIVAFITYTRSGQVTADSFTIPFALSALTAAIGAFLALPLKESKIKTGVRSKILILSPLFDRSFRNFLIVGGFYWFSLSFAWPLFPYVIINVVHASVWQIAVIASLSGLVVTATQPKFGTLIDKVGRKPILVISRASLFLLPLLYAFAESWLHLLAINALLSLSMSASIVSLRAYIMDSAPLGHRANYVAAVNLVSGLATSIGSLVSGVFTSQLSVSLGAERALFIGLIFSAILRLVSSSGFLLIRETLDKSRGQGG
ncbi:hypothetical protein CP083_00305 [Candidatus Bathyarchaeota archaeon B24-2]|nr:MAG: hypothetical protein CP083_00305 [Candidatus Bathyarchaeota archaeon B24-2]